MATSFTLLGLIAPALHEMWLHKLFIHLSGDCCHGLAGVVLDYEPVVGVASFGNIMLASGGPLWMGSLWLGYIGGEGSGRLWIWDVFSMARMWESEAYMSCGYGHLD